MAKSTDRLRLVVWALAAAAVSCHPIDTIRARRIARDGNALYHSGDFRGAIGKYREALGLDRDTPNAYLNEGYSLFSIYNPASADETEKTAAREAVAAFDQHILRYPKDERAKTFRIKTFLRAAPNDPELAQQAYSLFTDELRQHPNDIELKHFLVTMLADTREYQKAYEFFAPQIKDKPDDLDTMKALAIVADKSDKLEEAARWYRLRAEHGADNLTKATMFYELGTYAWNTLHYRPDVAFGLAGVKLADEGIQACRQAMQLKPEYAEAMAYANLLYLKRGIYEVSEEAKEIDENLALDLRTEASKIFNARKAATPESESQK
jgi:tetratricopeptide (TPR) repeat protein